MSATYELVRSGSGQQGIICRWCGHISYHPEDVRQKYCGFCHVFHPVASAPVCVSVQLVQAPVQAPASTVEIFEQAMEAQGYVKGTNESGGTIWTHSTAEDVGRLLARIGDLETAIRRAIESAEEQRIHIHRGTDEEREFVTILRQAIGEVDGAEETSP